MKTHPLTLVLALAAPVAIFAQSAQPVIKQSQHDKYPGGVYTKWDESSGRYKWYSPINGSLDVAGNNHQHSTANTITDAVNSNLFHLVKDINDATDAGAGNYRPQLYNQHFAVLNGVAYFAADDGIHGRELWRSDGTDAGTYLIKDIEPGLGSSGVDNITAANGKIYFSAATTANGAQPWISDGTAEGTMILKNISTITGGYPEMYTAVKNKVYFFTGRSALWVTDGTEAGTTLLYNDVSQAYALAQPVAAGNKLFFTAASNYYGSRQLWCSNGTVSGTFIPRINNGYYYSDPQQLTPYKGKLYFAMSSEYDYRRTIWSSDGTEAGTVQIANDNYVNLPFYEGVGQDLPDVPFTIVNGTFYFAASDYWNNTGIEMYKYSPENADGVLVLKDITPGWDNTNIQPFETTAFKDNLYFKVMNTDGTAALWRSDGTGAGTKAIKNFTSLPYTFYNLYSTPDNLFFEAYTNAKGFELWKTDGTNAGTQIAADIFPGIYSSYPYNYTAMGPGMLFTARNKTAGYELWRTDGTSASTRLAKDINTTSSGSSWPYFITPASGGVAFQAYDVMHGGEPFYSDGTETGTSVAGDILPGDFSSNPSAFKTVNDNVYFIAYNNSAPVLCKFNVTTKQITKLYEGNAGATIQKRFAVADNGIVFFQLINQGSTELWRTDGTIAGSFMLKRAYGYYGASGEIITSGNIAYFSFDDPYYGNELYKSDGTVTGTKLVNDLYAGSPGSNPYDFIVYKGSVYFAAYDEDGFTYLYTTNGTYAGTKKIKAITPVRTEDADKDMSRAYCISNGFLYIHVYDYSYGGGDALWKSDGTAAGTKLVRMFGTNYSGNFINNLTDVNGLVYFSANDGIYGNELWASNGTLSGTTIIKDITPGNYGSDLHDFCTIDGILYFLNGNSLWQSSGPGAKTKAVNDEGLAAVSGLHDLAASGNRLFIAGYTQETGEELYVADLTQQLVIANQTQNVVAGKLSFNAVISPNPVHGVATLLLPGGQPANIILVDNSGKTIWQQTNVMKTQLQIPMQQFAAGIYFVKISSGDNEKTIKLIKE